MQNPSFGAVKLVLALALTVCVLGAGELGSRIYALSYFAELQRQSAPMSAEAVASKAAPLLRAASNAEPVYAIVQSQHVDLSTKHQLLSELSANWQAEATVALIAVIVLAVLLSLPTGQSPFLSGAMHQGHMRANPSLHPTCYSGLRPLPQAGELKR